MNANEKLESKLREFLTDEEIKAGIEKGIIQMDIQKSEEAGKDQDTEDFKKMSSEDQEKAYNDTVQKAQKMRDLMGKKEEPLQKSFNEKDLETIEKSVSERIEKSFQGKLDTLTQERDDLSKKNETLEKSLGDLNETLSALSQKVEEISKGVPEPKSLQTMSFIEKGAKNEDGTTTLSLSLHKEKVIGLMEKSRVQADDIMKGKLDECILGLSGGGAAPTEDVAFKLFSDHNVKLVN